MSKTSKSVFVNAVPVTVDGIPATLYCADEGGSVSELQSDMDALRDAIEDGGEIALVDADTPQAAAVLMHNLHGGYATVAIRDPNSGYYVVVFNGTGSPYHLGHPLKPASARARSPRGTMQIQA